MEFVEVDTEEFTEETPLPGTGIMRVSTDLIKEWMLLPDGFEIVNAQKANGAMVIFTVKHKDVPLVPSGAILPLFTPIFQTRCDEDGTRWHRLLKISIGE